MAREGVEGDTERSGGETGGPGQRHGRSLERLGSGAVVWTMAVRLVPVNDEWPPTATSGWEQEVVSQTLKRRSVMSRAPRPYVKKA